jgi:MFS family permease
MGSLYMERVLHYRPLEIGLAFLPNTLAMAALSFSFSARLITRFGSRAVLVSGLVLITAGLFLFAVSPVHSDYWRDLLLPMILLGVGAGMAFPALTILAMSDATPADSGLASGLINTTTQVGAALGLAILATLSLSRTGQLTAEGRSAAVALSGGYHLAWEIGVGLVLAAILLAATLLEAETAPAMGVAEEESWIEEQDAIA